MEVIVKDRDEMLFDGTTVVCVTVPESKIDDPQYKCKKEKTLPQS